MSSKGLVARTLGLTAFLLAPAAAMAQDEFSAPPAASEAPTYNAAPGVQRRAYSPVKNGSSISVGGGVMSFSGGGARGLTDTGGSWSVRLTAGTRSILGIEAAYIGSAQGLSAPGLDPNARLIGNGAEGAFRLNVPVVMGDAMIEPFGLWGLGWTRFDVINDNYNTSVVREKDNIMTMPLGAGLATSYRGFLADARYTYRFAFRDALLGGADMGNWIVSANIGAEF
jgi:hypothetical protein